jgi:peptidoglycan hydrolase-like protein with peptidoglycan-binding domain
MAARLREGSRGPEVRKLQEALNLAARGVAGAPETPLMVDGIFGAVTRSRVVKFQAATRLVADGIVGRTTAKALLEVVLFALKK